MAFVVSSLTDYIDQSSTELIARSYFENRSAEYFGGLQTGIKTSAALQLLDVTAVAQADSACSFQASGNTTFTQRNITVGAVKYQDTLCPKALRAKWTQILLKQGSNAENEELTFATQIGDMLVELIKENVEVWDWQGDSGVVGFYDGLIKLIDAATTAVDGNTGSVASGTGIVVGNVVAIINAMCDAVPAKLKTKSDKVLFVGTEVFDKYVNALITANLFAVDATTWSDYVMTVPGKNVKVVGVHGLDATNRMFLGRTPNFHLGVDMENEEEEFKIWYSQDDDNIKYSVKFKRGVQVAYPSEIVEFTLTA
jgi:hypothetical protein